MSLGIIVGHASLFFKMVALSIALSACSTEKQQEFVWDDDVASITDKQLSKWLRKAPFKNEFGQQKEGKITITNARQVFPLVGRYYDAEGELDRSYDDKKRDPIFKEETVLYDDPKWGNLFIHGMLLYDGREVFLENHYMDLGNPFFEETDAGVNTHTATLYETALLANNRRYKTGIYWSTIGSDDYLLGFYQQGQLVFEAAIPLLGADTAAALNKLQEVNKTLGLNVAEWENATVVQLQRTNERKSFWQDPFVGIYFDTNYMLNDVYLKIKDTPFETANEPRKGDHYFSYQSSVGEVELYTELKKTDHDEAGFNNSNKQLDRYEYRLQQIYYEETQSGEYTEGTAKTYYKDNNYIDVHYRFPSTDKDAEAYIRSILNHIRVSKR